MTERNDYIFTIHLRERFVQRTNKKYNHVQDCREHDCIRCQELFEEIKQRSRDERREINQQIFDRLSLAEEDRSYLNNTTFMGWYYEKYGYDKTFEFLTHEDIVFVVVHDDGRKLIVTCVSSKTHISGQSFNAKPKFNKIKKKKDLAVEQF